MRENVQTEIEQGNCVSARVLELRLQKDGEVRSFCVLHFM